MAIQSLIAVSLSNIQNGLHWPGQGRWFFAESCARHLLVGTEANETYLPSGIGIKASSVSHDAARTGSRESIMLRGQDAYEFLLRFACGLESANAGEYFVLQDLRADWKQYKEKHANDSHANELIKVMDNIIADARVIRNQVYPEEMHPTRYEAAAALMAEVKKGDRVLLVADRNDVTKNMARALARDNSRCVGSITLTHADPRALRNRYDELTKLKENKWG